MPNSRSNFENLRVIANLYEVIFDNTQTATAITDETTIILLVNHKFCELSGYSKGEIEGKLSWKVLKPGDDLPRSLRVMNKFFDSDEIVYSNETILVDKSKNIHPVMIYMQKIPGTNYQITSLIDVSQIKNAEKALKQSRAKLRRLASHLVEVREIERKTLAHEIHDQLGQALTGINIDLDWLARKLQGSDAELVEKINLLGQQVESTIQEVKRISSDLRPRILDELGVVAAIEWIATELQRRTGIECNLEFRPKEFSLDSDSSTNLFRICQEALTNVTRHSHATFVNIRMYKTDKFITLRIRDNGVGIKAAEIDNSKSFGIVGIKERVMALGGTIRIIGRSGIGTILTVVVPVTKEVTR
ncbi:MAG: PAS domain-containing sensor histidine kinase [Dehalogenimonas sp.]